MHATADAARDGTGRHRPPDGMNGAGPGDADGWGAQSDPAAFPRNTGDTLRL